MNIQVVNEMTVSLVIKMMLIDDVDVVAYDDDVVD